MLIAEWNFNIKSTLTACQKYELVFSTLRQDIANAPGEGDQGTLHFNGASGSFLYCPADVTWHRAAIFHNLQI